MWTRYQGKLLHTIFKKRYLALWYLDTLIKVFLLTQEDTDTALSWAAIEYHLRAFAETCGISILPNPYEVCLSMVLISPEYAP